MSISRYDHTYNVYLRTGMVRMTDREVVRTLGADAFESDAVDHSEWCPCVVVTTDPPF